jgi:hypothetical protein
MTQYTQYTVASLIAQLRELPLDARVLLEDADTNWIIPIFRITYHAESKEVLIEPCGYNEMDSQWHGR